MTISLRPCAAKFAKGAVAVALFTSMARDLVPDPASAAERRPVRSLLEMRREHVVVQDFDLSCGAAALATLLNFQHGDPVSEKEIAEALIQRAEYLANPDVVRQRQGFSLLDLKRFVDGRGYEGVGLGQLTIEDLVERAPIIVPISTRGYDHFVIFRGRSGHLVVLADPAFGNRVMTVNAFEDAWLESPEFGRVGFVVKRRDGRPAPNRLAVHPSDLTAPPGRVLRHALSILPAG